MLLRKLQQLRSIPMHCILVPPTHPASLTVPTPREIQRDFRGKTADGSCSVQSKLPLERRTKAYALQSASF
ncbi:hypothetical protein M405DRAFT_743 [Rhizopogon salebrosus TDB-379]|nr:hypothetical protein M405DRAFT_743 [Rhizopogon salebrosus TDB-379]